MAPPRVGLSLMLGDGFRRAALPSFARGEVESIMWTYEFGLERPLLPPHIEGLLDAYGRAGTVSFHGVSASPLGAPPDDFDVRLAAVRALATAHRPARISEHFGFCSAVGFKRAAPLPMPRTASTVRRATERLARLGDACDARVGIENLAFAFSRADVLDEGAFLDAILAPIDGFLVLDLHNLYCRAVNFDLDVVELMARYPLERVLELHVSGGSEHHIQYGGSCSIVRRDTHDADVPDAVFALVPEALARCPNLADVFLERIPEALDHPTQRVAFDAEFARLRMLVGGDV